VPYGVYKGDIPFNTWIVAPRHNKITPTFWPSSTARQNSKLHLISEGCNGNYFDWLSVPSFPLQSHGPAVPTPHPHCLLHVCIATHQVPYLSRIHDPQRYTYGTRALFCLFTVPIDATRVHLYIGQLTSRLNAAEYTTKQNRRSSHAPRSLPTFVLA
jgi:hypothetical protein